LLDPLILKQLKNGRHLLAFSGGSDSTALFHLLHDSGIDFDIAHVNYQTRATSQREAEAAETLAAAHRCQCHSHTVKLPHENFEANARNVRYDFFESLIRTYGYQSLLTAHHLGDRLEWFLMQLTKGAGLYELVGMQSLEQREGYLLIRPLLHVTKSGLQHYLQEHGYSWFEDESNTDPAVLRNRFRHAFAAPLLEAYEEGILRSFGYLDEDAAFTMPQLHHCNALSFFKTLPEWRQNGIVIDRILKTRGFLMRRGDKEALKSGMEHVVGRRWVVAIGKTLTCIAPYRSNAMPKTFKEQCRLLGISPKLRPYLHEDAEAFASLESFLRSV